MLSKEVSELIHKVLIWSACLVNLTKRYVLDALKQPSVPLIISFLLGISHLLSKQSMALCVLILQMRSWRNRWTKSDRNMNERRNLEVRTLITTYWSDIQTACLRADVISDFEHFFIRPHRTNFRELCSCAQFRSLILLRKLRKQVMLFSRRPILRKLLFSTPSAWVGSLIRFETDLFFLTVSLFS